MEELRQSINRMIQSSGARLYQCAGVLSDEEFFYQPSLGSSFAWTVGHVINSQDYFVSRISRQARAFEKYEKVFRGGRQLGDGDFKAFPSREVFVTDYRQCHERTIKELVGFDMSRWVEPTVAENVGDAAYSTQGMMWEFLARHTFYHLGQLSATLPRLAQHLTIIYPNLTLN